MKIPRLFHNSDTGSEFERCSDCLESLSGKSEYTIEKALKNYPGFGIRDILWEFAICSDCRRKISDELSVKSKAAIEKYYNENSFGAMPLKEGTPESMVSAFLEKCGIKHTDLSRESDYCMALHYKVSEENAFVAAMSGTAMEELVSLLSAESIDVMNGSRSRLTGPLPEFADNPRLGVFI